MLALLLLQAVPAAPAPVMPPWEVKRESVNGAPATSTSAWASDGKARLVLRCDTSGTPVVSIQFIPKPAFPAATPRPVALNFDDNGWLGANWLFPGAGAYVSEPVIVTNLTTMLAHARSIRVHMIDPGNTAVDATFAGPASDAPVRAVLAACGYDLGKVPPGATPPPPPAAPDPAEDP